MIRIESVELDNFKSFGMKKVVSFNDGFTVISGPNGSGKSNIGDALLFVLGLRSTKQLRADRLPDFIHKAASQQRQKNYCRVTLNIIDDSDPVNGVRYNITRELNLEGGEFKSNYFLNGGRCRRSDVEDLIETLQIYLDSYSFVLQGDINNIVKMTGTERRKLLESISGIESYDVRLEKARKDIEGIVANVAVIRARTEEKSAQLVQLKIEKEIAEKYNTLTAEIGDLRLTIIDREIRSENRQSEMFIKEVEKIEAQIATFSEEYQSVESNILDVQKEIEALNEKIRSIQGEKSKQIMDKINDLKISRARALDAISDGRDAIISLRQEIDGTSQNRTLLEKKIASLNAEKTSIESKLKVVQEDMDSVTSKIKEMNEGELGTISDINELNLEFKRIEEELNAVVLKRAGVEQEINKLAEARSNLLTAGASVNSTRDHISMEIKDARWRLSQMDSSDKASGKKFADLQKMFESLRERSSSLKSRRNEEDISVKRMIRDQEKLSANFSTRGGRAVKTISDAVSAGELSGVFGTLKSLITVDEKYLKAIEASGGSRLNSVVVQDDLVAEKCLNALKREKTGRLTFMPLNKISVSSPRGKAVMLKNSGEALSFVHEVVQTEPQFRNVVLLVFGDTLLMRDIQSARKNIGGVRMVTLDGDIFEANGAITGGYMEQRNFIGDEMRLSKLMSEISAKESELKGIDDEISEIDEKLRVITLELTEASGKSAAGNKETAMYSKVIEENEPKLKLIESEIKANEDSIAEVEKSIASFKNDLAVIDTEREKLENSRKVIYSRMEKISPELINRKKELESTLSALAEQKESYRTALSDLDGQSREKKAEFSSSESLIESANKRITGIEEKITLSEDKLAKVNAEISDLEKTQLEIDSEISGLLKVVKDKEESERSLSSKRDDINKTTGELRESRVSLIEKSAAIKVKIDELEAQKSEISGVVLATDKSTTELKRRIAEISGEIEVLGSINHRAIEQYETEFTEVKTLKERIAELENEKAALENLMEQINNQKKLVFMELFDSVNREINSIYYELSDGGEAGLEITDRENPLDAEVYIKARPKGSNFSKLESLSGGEKSLTALAFIMSIQRINPSPVYYLDEVDMFLDGANAERVGKMFKGNSQKSQIIAVSLRQAMLKYADNIIGVTTFDDENSEVFFKSFSDSEEKREEE